MIPEKIETGIGTVELLSLLGKGKSGYSYLASLNFEQVVFKRMHDELCPYYNFTDSKIKLELSAYHSLYSLQIPMPSLLYHDLENQYLIKEYINGVCGHEWIAEGHRDDNIIRQLFDMSHTLKSAGLNIDFFPANFVISDDLLYYVDYEINSYTEEWNLENWGIYYWANREGIKEFFTTGDWRKMNKSAGSGIPIKAPFQKQVNNWIAKFGAG